MNISNKNTQFELFPSNRTKSPSGKKQPFLFKSLTLSLENIIVLCIVFIMVLVLSFSFGVEKGRKVVKNYHPVPDQQILTVDKNNATGVQKNIKISLEDKKPVTESASGEQRVIKDNEEILKVPIDQKIIPENFYTIQVASFKTINSAEREASGLKDMGHEIFVLPKGEYSIVCVGKFSQKTDAKQFSKKLKHRYSDCLIRRL